MAAEGAGLQGQPDEGMWVGSEGRQWSGDLPPTTSAAHTPWGYPGPWGPQSTLPRSPQGWTDWIHHARLHPGPGRQH
ncbi:hypothetical protein Y1Q_0007303 [Alligator mississippiensis]|uniref:Uncharacterized protein n=1 Tax=Alligator mississippiensis TaxID=8496 RepID=A0A151MP31_ALLMI|nr:hypothetical protein Y1Q_0007303 [Alligator mississippiensis]